MQGFSNSFLIFFYQIALGGLFALAATPFHELDRAFYKSTAGVLLVVAVLGFWGSTRLYWQAFPQSTSLVIDIAFLFHVLFIAFLACYFFALWDERQVLRARCFSLSLLSGLLGLSLTSSNFYNASFWSFETLLYPLSFFLSALLLGSVTVGMLIGHWYLIDTGQSLEPFMRVFRFFIVVLVTQSFFFIILPLVLYYFGSSTTMVGLKTLWQHHLMLLSTRVLSAQVAPLILSYMIWRTLKIPHTMAATGLFYIALLGVFVGEILGRQILALTSLPF
jgi:hypothetical protein